MAFDTYPDFLCEVMMQGEDWIWSQSCSDLTCCCTQHETNVGMTMLQLLFFQVLSGCLLLLLVLYCLLYFCLFDVPLVQSTAFMLGLTMVVGLEVGG